ncbi:ATP-binding cassette domain-containing protein [Sorangium sp. So ce1097]|uniref:ATP-binding cassette domain-containing protein n=1 Tax=Sorangium sp. So ce1097 TaxID=3133330 RepID=UPI003F62C036
MKADGADRAAALVAVAWEPSALGHAMSALTAACGLGSGAAPSPGAPPDGDPTAWIEAYAGCMGVEAEAVESSFADLPRAIASLGPAIVRVEQGYLAVTSAGRRGLSVLTPALTPARVPLETVRRALSAHLEDRPASHVDKWLAAARVSPRRAARARAELLAQLVADKPIGGMWLLRPDPGSSFRRLLAMRGVLRRGAVFLGAATAQIALGILAWWLIGAGALDGAVEPGWLLAWVLLSLSAIFVQLFASWAGGLLTIDVAALLKQRLLCGALRLDPAAIRARGSGELLAMVSESEAVETAGLGGALGAVVGLVQLASAAAILSAGAGGGLHVALLAGWTLAVGLLARRFARQRAAWTRERFAITSGFVENVVGHRTRVAQEAPHLHHVEEDAVLERYHAASRAMDRVGDLLSSLPARGWLALGLLGLVPAVLGGVGVGPLVVATGGILQAQAAFAALATSLGALLSAAVSWRSIARLFAAAANREPPGIPQAVLGRPATSDVTALATSLGALLSAAVSWRSIARLFAAAANREPPGIPQAVLGRPATSDVILEARGVTFRYPGERGEPALRDCGLVLSKGDRVLLEGRSGGGKSTLAAVLSGLHAPSSGLVLLRGLDRRTLGGAAWRGRVASAPQFHDNHVLSGTLAFNLLMGRAWPASPEDRREAELVCRKLGLGPLIDRMPSGLDQVVGETGWQLSHGERSRLFLARALLQKADVVILDESFGALDPLTARECVGAVIERAPALVVIAHP